MYGVGSDNGQLVVRDTRAAVTESISVVPHHRGITRLQFSPKQYVLIHLLYIYLFLLKVDQRHVDKVMSNFISASKLIYIF